MGGASGVYDENLMGVGGGGRVGRGEGWRVRGGYRIIKKCTPPRLWESYSCCQAGNTCFSDQKGINPTDSMPLVFSHGIRLGGLRFATLGNATRSHKWRSISFYSNHRGITGVRKKKRQISIIPRTQERRTNKKKTAVRILYANTSITNT